MNRSLRQRLTGILQRLLPARWVFVPIAIVLAAGPVAAAPENQIPWQVTADRLEHDRAADRYLAVGNVVIARQGVQLNADRVVLDHRTMYAEAEGHVMVTSENDVITGQRLAMNLETETGTIYQGTVFLSRNHFYLHGDRLQKLGPDTYQGDPVQLTTCDGPAPAWRITGRHLEVAVEGYGTLDHATFWARRLPLFYTPKLIFPAKSKRQTGLLPPELGLSDRLGEEYTQPFFWAIDGQQDATFYLRHMGRRGQMFGSEYRFVRDQASRGTVMVDFLDDRKIDDGTTASEQWAWAETPARGNRDRYWWRARIDQSLPGQFLARLDVDIVSDADYLREFTNGMNGFSASDRVFADTFGRELDAAEDPVRTNRLNINRSGSQYSLNLDTQWLDDVIGRRDDGVNDVLQQLQSVTLDGVRQPLLASGLYFDLDSEYRYFYLDNRRRAQRLDVHPRIYRPVQMRPYLSLEPSMGVRETVWIVDTDSAGAEARHKPLNREMVDFKLDATSGIYRVYRPGRWGIEALKHSILPQIVYDYTPGVVQDKYPALDDLDRLAEVNQITGRLTQTFTTRTQAPLPAVGRPDRAADKTAASRPVYREIGYIEISQTYDIIEAREENPFERSDPNRRRAFSPISLEGEFSPVDGLRLTADAQRSPYSDHYECHNVALQLADPRGDTFFVEHRYTYNSSQSVFTQLLVPLTDTLTTYSEWERNLHDRHNLQIGAGLLYSAQCWALDFGYLKEYGSGKRFAFMIHLFGLGGLGQASVIERRIRDPFAMRQGNPD